MDISAYNATVPAQLSMAIRDSGMKQYHVARKAGMSSQELSDIINNRRIVKANEIIKLALVLEIPPGYLLQNSAGEKLLEGYKRSIVETDEENPVIIATITDNQMDVADNYRVRLTPEYD